MNTWQIAEKLFNFCKEKYPDLDWNFDFTDNGYEIIQCLTFFNGSIEIRYGFFFAYQDGLSVFSGKITK